MLRRAMIFAVSALVIGTAAFQLGQETGLTDLSPASGPQTAKAATPSRFPSECVVSLREGRNDIRFLPRAGLTVTNHVSRLVRLFIQERAEVGAGESDLGTIEVGETKFFAHSLLAGRNVLHAEALRNGKPVRVAQQVMYIMNSGPFTCSRKFVWPIR
jgi:hypothetical protein